MKSLRKILAVSVAAVAALTLTACGATSSTGGSGNSSNAGRTVEQIKQSGTIRIATFGDLPPYGYKDNSGNYQGYDVYLAERMAKDLGVKIAWTQVNADSRVPALESDKVDLVLANFTVTPDRQKVIDFALPYMKVSVGVASPKSAEITKADQLNGKKVAVTKGTTAEQYIMQNLSQVQLDHYDTKTQQFDAFKQGTDAALADDNTYLYAWVKDNPNYTVGIKQLGDASTIAPGLKKGNKSLLNWLNKEIRSLTQSGFFAEDYSKELAPYFSSDVTANDVIMQESELK